MDKFTQWSQLFECKTLTGNQRVILGIILSLHNIEGWDFTPLSVLEERSGFTRPTIIKNLNVLVAKGLLNKSMNKSRQTNGTPPNDYVPIYDNIHNLLNSQRLKNFTLSQQEELKNFTPKELKNFTPKELKNFTPKELKNFTQEEKKEKIEKKKEKESYKEKEKRKSVTKDTINLQVLPDNENNNKIKLNMGKQITKNPENGNTPNNLESFLPSENTNPSSLQTNNGNPNDNSHCFSDSDSGCDNPNNLQIQASGRDNTKNGDNPNKGEMNNPKTAGTTKVIQIGDTRYAVETANTDYSSIWDSFPGGTANRENNKVQRVTTTEDRKDNTLSNASLNNENEDNPNTTKSTTAGQNTNSKTAEYNPKTAGATETAHRGFNVTQVDNYPTHIEKTPQKAINEGNRDTHNPMDCGGMSIDDLEDIYNGGNPTPTQPISKVRSQTTSKAKSNEGGGGRKFTSRKEWELLMENINTKVNNNIRPTFDEMNIIMEGARDKYRVITTLEVLYKMLFSRLKVNGYGLILTTCGDTLDDNKEAYTHKQYEFAWRTYDKCVDQFDIFRLENPTLNQ